MILKWIDYSGATHLIDGVAETVSYGVRHAAVAAEIAAYFDGSDVDVRKLIGPDVYPFSKADAEKMGHSWKGTVIESPDHEPGDVVETPGSSWLDYDHEHGPSRAVWLGDDGVDQDVTVIGSVDRSYGLYVVVSWADPDKRRSHLLIDCTRAYLMNDQGVTVDRLNE
jgi:hypothetical protein